ncbi:MAG: division/cell wall cluster transcriptional repressor MraZ [Candidatus Eisenbacteria bacterium]
MSNLFGSESVTLDAKGRLIVPSRMRKGLAPEANDTFVIVRGFDPCVNMYPLDEWVRFEAELRALKRGDDEVRDFIRVMFESMVECSLDGANRVLLTELQIEIGGFKHSQEVRMIGAMDKIEIWNPKRLEDRRRGIDTQKVDALARKFLT